MEVILGGEYTATYVAPQALSGATVACTVTAPDGTTTTPTPTVSGSVATASITPALVGTYLVVWTVSGSLVDAQQDQFSVEAAALDLVSLSDVRDELNINPADISENAKLRRYIRAANFVVENITGPIRKQTRTDVFDGDVEAIVLPFRWVSAISDIHETRGITNYTLTEQPLGQSLNAWAYTWDRTVNKIIRRAYGGAPALFAPGLNVVSVTYTLGIDPIPQDIQVAVTELIRHWWQFGQLPKRGPFGGQPVDDGGVATVVGYSVPNRVLELLEPWRRRPGIW